MYYRPEHPNYAMQILGLTNERTIHATMTTLDIFRPDKNAQKDCIVMNPEGGAVSGLMTRSEAEAYAAKAVAGRITVLNGMVEAFVCHPLLLRFVCNLGFYNRNDCNVCGR